MSDALERLKNRKRPTVPPRDASLTPIAPSDSASADTSISGYQKTKKTKSQASGYQKAKKTKSQAMKTPKAEPSLQTKQSTMRLEQELSDRLQDICRQNGISREVLIEALFEYSEVHPDMLSAVLTAAKLKNEHRQQIANLKRAKSMMDKFGR